ncbi:hypothetical protein DRO54_11470 [Candidatus Bathyarchaeota archaeon]|nr:MAG: hypothetical protein DRO54_11470 [Candidatus Bathyarchaeota archaeon]
MKADSREELAEQTVKVSDALGSEGNVAKPADSLYRLKQGSGRQLQFNKSVVLNVVILRKNDGKVEDVYTYDYGIKPGDFEIHAGDKILLDDEEYAKVGTTLPTKASFEPLDRIQVEVETLNFGEYPENKVRISGYPPRLLGCGEELDDMGTVKEKAEKNGVLVQKRYGVEGLPKLLTCNENTLLTKVKEYDASEMRDDDLLDDWRIVNTWWANFKEGKKLEHDEETIRNLGRKIFRELVRRGKLTFHPESLSENALNFLETLLEYEADTRGFILKDAELIGDAKKKAIVRARPFEFDGFHSLAGTDGKVWGWVRFGFTKENTPEGIKASKDVFIRIDGDDFKKLRKYHWITDSEKEQWWPGKSKLYFHPIREFVPYSGKHKIDVPSDHQGYVKGMFIEEQVGAYEAHNESDITDVKLSVLPLDAKANAEIKKWRSLSRQGLEKYDPNKLPVGFFHLANHFRGETAHMDFRFKFLGGQEARGFTIAHQKPGVIKEPIKTLAQASKISNPQDSKYWKFTPDSGAGQHVMAFQKGKMPLKWLTMVRNVEEPGGVGATKEYPGVFFGVDWGLMFPGVLEGGRFGTSKPDFREFFLYGSDFKGRLVFRLVENRPDWEKSGDENLIWQGWMAKDQTPYIMTAKARRERSYIPPEGVSGLPPQLEAKVPAELRWWTPEVKTKDEAFELMDKTRKIFMDNDYIGEGVEYALTKDGEYRLHYFWAKGLKTVKDLKNKDFVLRLRMDGVENTCYFGDNPYALQEGMSLTGVAKDTPGDAPKGEWFDYEGVLPPEHSAAPHTKFSTNVEIISRGRFNSVEQKDGKFIVCFKGGMLSGRFLMEKESGDFDRWRLQKI